MKQKVRQVLEPYQRTKTSLKNESDSDTNCSWCLWNGSQRLGMSAGKIGNHRTKRDHQNYSIVKIDQNTGKSPGDQRRLNVIQTPVKDHHHVFMKNSP